MGDAGPRTTPESSGDRVSRAAQVVVVSYLAIRVPLGLAYLPDLRPEHPVAVGVVTALILLAAFPLVLGGMRRFRPGHAIGLLAALTVLTYLPLALTGTWPLPLAACLAFAALVVLRRPLSWLLALTVVVVEVVIRLGLDQPFFMVSYGVTATVNGGLQLYALAWFVALARELHTTRSRYAEAVAARERLESVWVLRDTLVGSLTRIEKAGQRALESLTRTPGTARTELDELIRVARRASSTMRDIAAAQRGPFPSATPKGYRPGGRLTWLILLALAVTVPGQQILLVSGEPGTTWPVIALVTSVSAGLMVVMVRHSATVLRDVRPKGWPVTLTLQAVLTLVPYLLFGPPWNCASGPLAVMCMLLIRSPWRWLPVTAVALVQNLTWLMWDVPFSDGVLHMVVVISLVLSLYAASRLGELAGRLNAVRDRLAVMAVLYERLRLSRDIHDLLGLGLSTITLKAELAARLVDTDPCRARQELTELVALTARSLAQVRTVTGEDEQVLALDDEATEAQAALVAAGAEVKLDLDDAPLPPELDTTLAVLLRESVTNILRHATPARCTIKTTATDGVLQLQVDNDGVLDETRKRAGSGLANLAARAQAAGGVLTAGPDANGTFVLRAELPLPTPPLSALSSQWERGS